MLCSLSSLKDQDLDKIRSLENELGKTILAFSCHQAAPAALDNSQLSKIQGLEKEMGLSLVAVD
jgi:hypothetical protein